MTVVITATRAEHVVTFRETLDAVAREKKYLSMVQAPPLEQMQRFVQDNLHRGSPQFVALDGQQVVGWADVIPGWAHGVAHTGRLGMGVLRPYRGQGIGRRLLEACIACSWEIGLARLELEVRGDNEHAIRLYRRLGFVLEGNKRRGIRIEHQYHDLLQMGLLRDEELKR